MNRLSKLLLPFAILILTLGLLCYPQAAYDGALRGLNTWVTNLLPALLPFLIFADLLVEVGLVRFLGVLLEPVMRPLFKLPGEAGFAVALGFTSGFPMGAILTTSLYEQKLCTQEEAARLAAFTNNASPLFLLITVPITMLEQPQLGFLLLAAHYLANFLLGIFLGFWAARRHKLRKAIPRQASALQSLLQYREAHPLPLGAMLRNAVQKGIQNITIIGGFVLFFSVLLSILQQCGMLTFCNQILAFLLAKISLSPNLSEGICAGIFEMTLGASFTASCDGPLLDKLMLISFILGWSGISIQAQVSSIITPYHISSRTYLLCRPLQGLLAAAFIPILLTIAPQILTVSTQTAQQQTAWSMLLFLPLATFLFLLAASLLTAFFYRIVKKA